MDGNRVVYSVAPSSSSLFAQLSSAAATACAGAPPGACSGGGRGGVAAVFARVAGDDTASTSASLVRKIWDDSAKAVAAMAFSSAAISGTPSGRSVF